MISASVAFPNRSNDALGNADGEKRVGSATAIAGRQAVKMNVPIVRKGIPTAAKKVLGNPKSGSETRDGKPPADENSSEALQRPPGDHADIKQNR
jgi:hypothetical protein